MSAPSNQPDWMLAAQAQAGQRECFAELVRRYQKPLLRVAFSRLGRADWAEDVVQDTFLAAFRSLASYDTSRGFRTWLWTILLNECHRHYYRRTRQAATGAGAAETTSGDDALVDASQETPLARLLARERTEQLDALLARLSDVQADALRLRFFGGLKFHEMAEAMGCSLNTAKNRVRWGLTRMAEMLEAAAPTGSLPGTRLRAAGSTAQAGGPPCEKHAPSDDSQRGPENESPR